MAAKKIRDLAVKTSSYTDRDGNQKNRYKNVGSLMKSDDGGTFILLDTTFNPAGVPNPDCRDNVLISVFELREDGDAPQRAGGSGGSRGGAPQRQRPATATSAPVADDSDDIPFILWHSRF